MYIYNNKPIATIYKTKSETIMKFHNSNNVHNKGGTVLRKHRTRPYFESQRKLPSC